MRSPFHLFITPVLSAFCCLAADAAEPMHQAELVFPLHDQHNHAPGIVELPDGGLLVSWYRGSGERSADDVAVYGALRAPEGGPWTEAFLLVDTPGFPDCNTCLMCDDDNQIWLFWPVILANSWESCITHYRVYDYEGFTPFETPVAHGSILLKPADFSAEAIELLDRELGLLEYVLTDELREELDQLRERLADKLYQRLGWQPRCKPTVLASGRILLPLYSDTYSFSIMAISDDGGQTWYASEPLMGFGNIQPAVLQRRDGTLVAYMRENGPRNLVRVCESTDEGLTWGEVGVSDLSNPGSGLDGVVLHSGRWLLVYNDTVDDRNSLAVSLSDDEGLTWTHTRHLEQEETGSYHYPAVIEARDGTIHCVYSYFVDEGKSMKHAAFNEEWVLEGE